MISSDLARLIDAVHREKNILRQTVERERERLASDSQTHTRVQMLEISKIVRDQNEVVMEAREAAELLAEEGSTVVFPAIVEDMIGDMENVAGRLTEGRTAVYTQQIETDIIATLEELIEALKEEQERRGGQGGGEGIEITSLV